MEVTEGYGDPVAIYRDSHPYGFAAVRLNADLDPVGSDLTVYPKLMVGVYYTGTRFFATRIGSQWYAVTTGADFWSQAVTQEAIDGSGDVELFEDGPIVEAEADSTVAASTAVYVEFDDDAQEFVISGVLCPPAPNGGG